MVSRGVAKKRVPAAKKGQQGNKAQPTLAQKLAQKLGASAAAKPGAIKKPGAIRNQHTLLLLQSTTNKSSRTWHDFPTLEGALDAFTSQYEAQLRKLNPQLKQLTYTVQDLHVYADSLADLSLMVLDPATKQYKPQGKPYVKSQLLERLKKQAR